MTVKNFLKQFDKEQLIGLISELDKNYKIVHEHLAFLIKPDVNDQKEKVRLAIHECFFPKRGDKLRLKDARQALNNFKKLSPDPEALSDIMLYFAECGVKFTKDYGDINEAFYISIESMFRDACILIRMHDLCSVFQKRALKVVTDTDGMGWGFHDDLFELYHGHFEL